MARKIDPEMQENVDRRGENEQSSGGEEVNNNHNEEVRNESDTIKNANATGLGAIGRDDQKSTSYESKDSY